jgi:GDP-L-fucose synthase
MIDRLGDLASLPPLLNVGCGYDKSVREFYEIAREVVGFDGELQFDPSKPAGMKQKLMDSTLARSHGWDPTTTLEAGMAEVYAHYLKDAQ